MTACMAASTHLLHLNPRHFVECCWNRENPAQELPSAKRIAAMLDQAAYLLEK